MKNPQSLVPLKNALESLKKATQQPVDEFIRDSVIQRFEFSFELSWKNLKRYLETDRPLVDDSIKAILREAHQRKLISDIDQWFSFHKARNLSSHTYNESTAAEVYQDAVKFLAFGEALLATLQAKLNS